MQRTAQSAPVTTEHAVRTCAQHRACQLQLSTPYARAHSKESAGSGWAHAPPTCWGVHAPEALAPVLACRGQPPAGEAAPPAARGAAASTSQPVCTHGCGHACNVLRVKQRERAALLQLVWSLECAVPLQLIWSLMNERTALCPVPVFNAQTLQHTSPLSLQGPCTSGPWQQKACWRFTHTQAPN